MINSRIIDNYSNGQHSNGNGNGNIDNKPSYRITNNKQKNNQNLFKTINNHWVDCAAGGICYSKMFDWIFNSYEGDYSKTKFIETD